MPFDVFVSDPDPQLKALAEYREALLRRQEEKLALSLDDRSRSYAAGVAARIRAGVPPERPLYVKPVEVEPASVVRFPRKKR